jgi:uncharacterized membrane protein YkgB
MPVKMPNSHTIYPKTSLSNIIFSVEWFNRLALFVVFFWFGFLKILKISPAEQLVTHLHEATIASLIPIDSFLLILGAGECLIGLVWLFPKWTKLAFWIFIFHMFATFLPLLFLPKDTWQNTMVLTLTGQYIIKNVVLVASAYTILKITNK